MKKRVIALFLFIAMVIMTCAPVKVQGAAKPAISKSKASMELDSQLTLKVTNLKATDKIVWSSSKKAVATVSNKGVVTAKGEGTATITATVNSKSDYVCKVTVVDSNKKETNSAGTGTRMEPFDLSVRNKTTVTINNNTVELALKAGEVYTGSAAEQIIMQENILAKTGSGQQWILFKVTMEYISNTGGDIELYARNILYSADIYDEKATSTVCQNSSVFVGERKGKGENNVKLYPGAKADVWYGILVDQSVKGFTCRVGSDDYKWFALDFNSKPKENKDDDISEDKAETGNSAEQNFKALKKSLKENGSIVDSTTRNQITYSFLISYDEENDGILFIFLNDTDKNDAFLMHMKNTKDDVTLEYAYLFDADRGFSAEATSKISKLNENSKVNWNLTYTDTFLKTLEKDVLDTCDSVFKVSFSTWEALLNRIGTSLRNIGFTSV